ncbi:hypothetical protein LJB91_01930 [Bacteroidales bacterium OttesenSCG-928-L03]|nr:hypothetical protein [Bacteroidales bacterium OttesenSCG-928-L03]
MKETRDIELRDLLNQTARLRLFRNSNAELGEYIGYNLNSNNSINRIPPFTARCLLRELSRTVQEEIASDMDLEEVLARYEIASLFYTKYFKGNNQRKDRETIVLILKRAYIYNYIPKGEGKTQEVLAEVENLQIDIPILLLLVLKILPRYTSAQGDVKDSRGDAEKLLVFLREFFRSSNDILLDLPLLQRFEKEIQSGESCSRLYLIHIATEALTTFHAYSDPQERYQVNLSIEKTMPNIGEAIWVEPDKLSSPGNFWMFEPLASGDFFLYYYKIDERNKQLSFVRYEAYFLANGILSILHPRSILPLINKQLPEGIQSLFNYEMDNETEPNRMELEPLLTNTYPFREKTLVRMPVNELSTWLNKLLTSDLYEKRNEYPEFDYQLLIMSLVVSEEAVYVQKSEAEASVFYRVPKSLDPGLELIQVYDAVGVMNFRDKTYLSFVNLMLHYDVTTEESRSKYGIELVSLSIE